MDIRVFVACVCAATGSSACNPFGGQGCTGGSSQLCDADLSVMVWQETTCTDTTTDAGVTHQCDPIPGEYYEAIALPGTPAQVHVWQYLDDAAILDAAAAPSYKEFAPNGRECGPICRQATVSWMFE